MYRTTDSPSLPPPKHGNRVAATNTPIIFIGTGEHLHDLEKFSPQPFISKMLGMGDMQGLVERAQEMAMANPERQENMMKKLEKGEFTIRDLKEQLNTVMGMCVPLLLPPLPFLFRSWLPRSKADCPAQTHALARTGAHFRNSLR